MTDARFKLSRHFPLFGREALNIDWVPGAEDGDVIIRGAQVILSGTPHALTFAGLGWPVMADASYVALVGGETATALEIDQSALLTTGLTILNGLNAEVAHILVLGAKAVT